MKNIIKKIEEVSKETHLTQDEKFAVRNNLLKYMSQNPVQEKHAIRSPWFASSSRFRGKKVLSAVVLLGVVGGGTLSFAAEAALPGDVLYPVKTGINEPVHRVVLFTPQEKADWDVRLVERRLDEISKLSESNAITPEAKAIIESRLEAYTDRVKNNIDTFENEEDYEQANEVLEKLNTTLGKYHSRDKDGDDNNFGTKTETVNTAGTTTSIPVALPLRGGNHEEGSYERVQKELEYVQNKRSILVEKRKAYMEKRREELEHFNKKREEFQNQDFGNESSLNEELKSDKDDKGESRSE